MKETIFTISGPQSIEGIVDISCSKNSSLPILAASLLSDETVIINNLPNLLDTNSMLELLKHLGSQIVKNNNNIKIDNKKIKNLYAPYELVSKMRASVLILGPLLARYKQISLAYPGGCLIGKRPIDMHLDALKKMKATIQIENGYIHAKAPNGLFGAEIHFTKNSVGATEQIIMAACLAKGKTTLYNAAMEPEIVDLSNFLINMGAKIEGAGSNTIKIHGVDSLFGTTYTPIPDRLEAATFLTVAAVSNGHVLLKNVNSSHIQVVLDKFKKTGAAIITKNDTIEFIMNKRPKNVDIITGPYPAFPTDLQPIFMTLNAISSGKSFIKETIFENRFSHVPELIKMQANLKIENNITFCEGVNHLEGANVQAHNLRAAASLVIAGIAAVGKTVISGIEHLDRGYENFDLKLQKANICIERSTLEVLKYAEDKVY